LSQLADWGPAEDWADWIDAGADEANQDGHEEG